MTNAIAFDTLQYAKKLISAGFTQQQAEVQAEALAEIIDEKLATKNDLEKIKNEIIIKLGGIVISTGGIMLILMKLFRL